jgi:hypothetical protein
MREKCPILFCLIAAVVFALCAPAQAQTSARRKAEVTTTEFGLRGTIHIVDSFGEVNVEGYVEGWDKPEVEGVVAKTTQKQYEPKNLAKGSRSWGASRSARQKLLGAKMESEQASPARRLFLRGGIGDIQVSKMRNDRPSKSDVR